MNRSHDTALDRSQIIQCLSHRREAVRGAGSGRNNRIFRLQCLMVNIVNDGRQVVSSRSGDNDLTSASLDMCACLCFGCIEASALQNNVNTQFAPRQVLCICFLVDRNFLTINSNGAFTGRNRVSQRITALSGVVF